MLTVTHTWESGFRIESMAKAYISMLMESNIQEVGWMAKSKEPVATSGQMVPGMKVNMTKANSTVKGSLSMPTKQFTRETSSTIRSRDTGYTLKRTIKNTPDNG